jgi:hypothetical protein
VEKCRFVLASVAYIFLSYQTFRAKDDVLSATYELKIMTHEQKSNYQNRATSVLSSSTHFFGVNEVSVRDTNAFVGAGSRTMASTRANGKDIPRDSGRDIGDDDLCRPYDDRWKSITHLPGAQYSHHQEMFELGSDYTPKPMDVICARGKSALQHAGNIRLRTIIEANLSEYERAESKLDKSLLVSSIIHQIRRGDDNSDSNQTKSGGGSGGFVKQMDGGVWFEVGYQSAREKCGQW